MAVTHTQQKQDGMVIMLEALEAPKGPRGRKAVGPLRGYSYIPRAGPKGPVLAAVGSGRPLMHGQGGGLGLAD